ncbi:MAG: hypothetical protein J5517_03745 [Eubacterium sp.]|nr:hypothetical protein [Eubacterium sp.]
MTNNYFGNLIEYLKENYEIDTFKQSLCDMEVDNIIGIEIDDNVKNIYEHYKLFNLVWFKEGKYWGEINYVPYEDLDKEHEELVEIMKEIYDTNGDKYELVSDIMNWYPLFYFGNGDAFCLDKRNGNVVLYEHEVYDSGKNLHGLIIARTIDDLYYKWSKIHFADVYYWDKICNDEGIDINSEFAHKYLL